MTDTRDDEFRAFVVRSRPGLVRTATLLGGDRHLAEDLVQTILTRIYVARPRIRSAEGPEAYARRALVNALIDERRRPLASQEVPLPTDGTPWSPSGRTRSPGWAEPAGP